MSESGARPMPGAPKRPPAVSQPASRPASPGYGTDNNNQDSNKRPKPQGSAPDSFVDQPEGKCYA